MSMGSFTKWLFDRGAAFIGLLVMSPLIALVSLLVRLFDGSPILFRQQRPGLHGKVFTLYKFRTMREEVDSQGRPLPDGDRLTKLGRTLRRMSIDELPQLVNVLKGDMSFVGPRPLLVEYLSLYTPEQARRHEVRPGLTGLAVVSGRNDLSWEEKFALDTYYAEHHSWGMDIRILGRTVIAALTGKGISQEGHATTAPFTGSTRA